MDMAVEITWYGHSCFRLVSRGEPSVVTDPYGEGIGYTLPALRADIVTISHEHSDHCHLQGVRGRPKVLCGPGEYEIGGVFITGISTYHDNVGGKQRGKNTMYLFEFSDLTLLHMGDLGHVLTQAEVAELDDVDVLFVPVGGGPTINGAQAAEVVSLLEPKIVIPMHYKTPALAFDLDPVSRFLKAMGSGKIAPVESFRASRSELREETRVVLLEYKQ